MSELVQYIIVFILLAAIIVWIIARLCSKQKPLTGGCSSCALAEKCTKKEEVSKEKDGKCDELTKN